VLDKPEEIEGVVSALKDKETTCHLRLSDGSRFDNVRVLENKNNQIKFRSVKNGSALVKSVAYDEVELLEVSSSSNVMVSIDNEESRWGTLDPAADIDFKEKS
jgi:hypothetical protein